MVDVHVIPTSPGYSATTQQLLVEATEKVCRPYCVNSMVQPSATAIYTAGPTKVVGTTAIVPITAVITVVSPTPNCGCAHTQVFTETFNIAFVATGTNTATLTQVNTIVEPAYAQCCKARGVKVSTVLSVQIA